MLAVPPRDGSVFQQIFAEHWEAFQQAHTRYQTPYYDELVAKMLACGHPTQIGSSATFRKFTPKRAERHHKVLESTRLRHTPFARKMYTLNIAYL